MKKKILLTQVFIVIFAAACGPTSEILAVTMVAETDEASTLAAPTPTLSPTPIPSPTPTLSPTPTIIPTATPTATPIPDSNAMINWQELHLDSSFEAVSPYSISVEKGEVAFGVNTGSGAVTFIIENSFVFAEPSNTEQIFGYTVNLSTVAEIDIIDDILPILKDFIEPSFNSGGRTLLDIATIPGANTIGESSMGVEAEYMSGGRRIVVEQVAFRIGDIYAAVFVKNFGGTDPSISAIDVARIYASSIKNPIQRCQITHISQVEGATWPSYDFAAEGFYPSEARITLLEGDLQIDDEPLHVAYADGLGEEPDALRLVEDRLLPLDFDIFIWGTISLFADNQGQVSGSILLTSIVGPEVTLPIELTFSVFGLYSGCEISETLTWP